MRSPSKMTIIEIDITNACDKRCSNCTRLCGHQQKPYFMDFETFKRAVDSLDGYEGIRSLMGGEPTLHPEYERFIHYIASKFPERFPEEKGEINPLAWPQKEFIKAIQRVEYDNYEFLDNGERLWINGPGMFSNMGNTYRKYYELCNDILPFQGLNDHMNPIYHQSALITRKELGIPDEEWIPMRDKCWIQNEWSASITPKGCFFCEVAGVLDMLLDGPGGWPIEPGWWKRTPDQFGDQLHWCELCGFALDTFTRDSAEEIDDISPEWYERLKALKSPKLASGRANVIKIENGQIAEESKRENKHFSAAMPYIEHYEDRFNALNSVLFQHEYDLIVLNGKADKKSDRQFAKVFELKEGEGFGVALYKALRESCGWLAVRDANSEFEEDFVEHIGKYVLNPGTMHYSDGRALFSNNAWSLKRYGMDRVAQLTSFQELVNAWQKNKVVPLSFEKFDEKRSNFKIKENDRIAVWGTGSAGSQVADAIRVNKAKLVAAYDIDPGKQDKDFYGVKTRNPQALKEHLDEFDYLVAANYTRFKEIKAGALEMGVSEDRILLMNQL
ncbi:MAG: radical SAM protein [Lachnospiraceae bacterium]|nr:radical SAM protein [Lachnospiraceae bacterium]